MMIFQTYYQMPSTLRIYEKSFFLYLFFNVVDA